MIIGKYDEMGYWKVLLLLLFFLALFEFNPIMPSKPTIIDYPLLLSLVLISSVYIQFRECYSKLILLYLIFVFLSCVYSHYANEQNFLAVVAHSYPYLSLMFFYYLLGTNISYKEAENVLITLAIICCFCYIIQWIVYPNIVFHGAYAHADARTGIYRVRIPGSICCYCLFFYGINKFVQGNGVKNLLFSLLGFLPIIIQGFRTLTLLSVIFGFCMIQLINKKTVKTIYYSIMISIIAFVLIQLPIVQSKINEMIDRQTSGETFSNSEYVRLKEIDYYWNEQFKDPLEKIMGGGEPTDSKTKYAKQIYGYAYSHGLYWDDWGLIGLSWIIGIPAVSLLVALYLLSIYKLSNRNFQYLRFTLIVVLLGSFTTAELFRKGNILIFSLIIYINYRYYKEKKQQALIRKVREAFNRSINSLE